MSTQREQSEQQMVHEIGDLRDELVSTNVVVASARALVQSLDGTYARSWADKARELRGQTWPCEVNPDSVAELIEVLLEYGMLEELDV